MPGRALAGLKRVPGLEGPPCGGCAVTLKTRRQRRKQDPHAADAGGRELSEWQIAALGAQMFLSRAGAAVAHPTHTLRGPPTGRHPRLTRPDRSGERSSPRPAGVRWLISDVLRVAFLLRLCLRYHSEALGTIRIYFLRGQKSQTSLMGLQRRCRRDGRPDEKEGNPAIGPTTWGPGGHGAQ